MFHNRLTLRLTYFSADTGGGAGSAAAATDTGTAGAGDHNAATGGAQQGAPGDNTAGGGDNKAGSGLSAEDLQRYEDSEFLKFLGVDSIETIQSALEKAGVSKTTENATEGTNTASKAADDVTLTKDEKGGQGEQEDANKTAQNSDAKQADQKTAPEGEKKAETDPDKTKAEEKKPEDLLQEKDGEILTLKAQLAAAKHNVDEESFEDVYTLASTLAKKGDGMEIGDAIKAIVEKYPQFTGAGSAAPEENPRPRFGSVGSQRTVDDRDAFARALLGQ